MTLADRLRQPDAEGEVLHLYYDVKGIPTIGVGCNLTVMVPLDLAKEITITKAASDALLQRRIDGLTEEVVSLLPWVTQLSRPRQDVLLEIAFWAGIGGLLGFHKMLAACHAGDFPLAGREIWESELTEISRVRTARLQQQMATGVEA
jgi:GH24 family phage-related lysozyme (muramidase)